MDGEGMQLSYTLHFKGSKRYRLIKQQTLINIQQKNLTKHTRMDTEFELQWQKSKDKHWQGCFEIDSMFRTSVHCFFSNRNELKGNKNYFKLAGGSTYWGLELAWGSSYQGFELAWGLS